MTQPSELLGRHDVAAPKTHDLWVQISAHDYCAILLPLQIDVQALEELFFARVHLCLQHNRKCYKIIVWVIKSTHTCILHFIIWYTIYNVYILCYIIVYKYIIIIVDDSISIWCTCIRVCEVMNLWPWYIKTHHFATKIKI